MKKKPTAVRFTVAALLVMASTIVLQTAGGADYPVVPPGLVLPLAAAALLVWRPGVWTESFALANGLWIGFGALVAPDAWDNLASGNSLVVVATAVELVMLVLITAGATWALVRRSRTAGGRRRATATGDGR
ncbi:hypothetical protein [Streptomyces sp. NPDC003023]|uniref:hypothetical protein n=1 Tax=Streptomyces sp. NPDC003023 TaxID=3364675 RepID=UPI0036829915